MRLPCGVATGKADLRAVGDAVVAIERGRLQLLVMLLSPDKEFLGEGLGFAAAQQFFLNHRRLQLRLDRLARTPLLSSYSPVS